MQHLGCPIYNCQNISHPAYSSNYLFCANALKNQFSATNCTIRNALSFSMEINFMSYIYKKKKRNTHKTSLWQKVLIAIAQILTVGGFPCYVLLKEKGAAIAQILNLMIDYILYSRYRALRFPITSTHILPRPIKKPIYYWCDTLHTPFIQKLIILSISR